MSSTNSAVWLGHRVEPCLDKGKDRGRDRLVKGFFLGEQSSEMLSLKSTPLFPESFQNFARFIFIPSTFAILLFIPPPVFQPKASPLNQIKRHCSGKTAYGFLIYGSPKFPPPQLHNRQSVTVAPPTNMPIQPSLVIF